MKILEVLADTDPKETEYTITQSFKDGVISDLIADESQKGDLVSAESVINNIRQQFPSLSHVSIIPSRSAERVRIYFVENGKGERIEVPLKLRKGLGEILVLHEIAHLLYTKDILTNKIIKHRAGPQAFTILRVLEDISIEKQLERDFPNAVEVFKSRAAHIIPIYKSHTPSKFAKSVDQMFLYLRGYSKQFDGDPYVLRYANQYLESTDAETKIDAVLNIIDRLGKM